MSKVPKAEDILLTLSAASVGDYTSRVEIPDGADFDDSTTNLAVAVNLLLEDLAFRAEIAEKRLRQTSALNTIDKAILNSLDLGFTMDVVLTQVLEELEVDAANVFLYDQSSHSLEYFAGKGFQTLAAPQARVSFGKGYTGRAVLERKRVSISNLQSPNAEFNAPPEFASEGFIDFHAIPMIAKGKVLGVLQTFRRSEFEASDEWIRFLETLASQAAIAIENISLWNQLQKANDNLLLAYDAAIEGWSKAMDLRDHETEGHSQRVAKLTLTLARNLGVREEDLVHIRRGALLHDIGKVGIPDSVLLKPDKLTEEEWGIMKQHAELGRDLLSSIIYLQQALDIPYCHHERWDGSGYPQGLQGKQIPFSARIFSVADVYDALTSDRPYRDAWPEEKAIKYISEQSGTHFDPQVVEAFLEMMAE